MKQYKAYFDTYFPENILKQDGHMFESDEAMFDAIQLFIEHAQIMQANFDEVGVLYKDLSYPQYQGLDSRIFDIYNENPKLMPRKGRFYIREGQIEFVYENREFDALNGETHEYSGKEYINWYSNDEIEDKLALDTWHFEAVLRNFIVRVFRKMDDGFMNDLEGLGTLSLKIVDNKIVEDVQVHFSGDLSYEMSEKLITDLKYDLSPIFRNKEFSQKLEEVKGNLSPISSVMNTSLLYLVRVYNRLIENMKHDFNIIRTGREGEEKVIREVNKISNFVRKEGYTIAYGDDSFESDLIVINEYGVHLLEVKNYGSLSDRQQNFEITDDGQMHFYVDGQITQARTSPVLQVKRHQQLMEKMLQEQGFDVPVKAYVVMANDYISFVNHSDVPVLSLYQVENYLRNGEKHISVQDSYDIGQIIESYKRDDKKFPVFNYRKVFEEISEEIIDNTARFIQYEMYDHIDLESVIAVSIFGEFAISSMFKEVGYEQRLEVLKDLDKQNYLKPINEVLDTMQPTEKIGLFTFPSLLNFMRNRQTRLILIFIFTLLSGLSTRRALKVFFAYQYGEGFFSSIYSLSQMILSKLLIWQIIASMALILYYVSKDKVQDYILQLSQNEFPFWKGDLSQKIANFLKIRSYRNDERGNLDLKLTFRNDKFNKIRIMLVLSVIHVLVLSIPGMSLVYLVLLIMNTILIIKKSL